MLQSACYNTRMNSNFFGKYNNFIIRSVLCRCESSKIRRWNQVIPRKSIRFSLQTMIHIHHFFRAAVYKNCLNLLLKYMLYLMEKRKPKCICMQTSVIHG